MFRIASGPFKIPSKRPAVTQRAVAWKQITDAANVSFAKRLRERRQAAGFSQAVLGQRARIDKRFIREMERGLGNPSLGTMALVADALGCSVADLVK